MIHDKVSAVANDTDSSTVSPSDWNATHVASPATISSDTTLTATHDLVVLKSGATATLPAASARAQIYRVVNGDTVAAKVQCAGSDTILGLSEYDLPNQYDYVRLESDGVSVWHVTAQGSPV